jgi:phosphatidate cytidylyltransferase
MHHVAAPSSDLPKRMASGLAMAALALGTAWVGGIAFDVFWAAAAALILWEWVRLPPATQRLPWVAPGLLYAGIAFLAPVMLRADEPFGLLAVLFLFGVVWATDILGYAAGRLAGGPKLWPAVSPKKTWSGALGGTFGAALAGAAVAHLNALALWPLVVLAIVLSIAAQAGDLLESAIKRKFNVKDTSHLIPGHGGVMDRLDGFILAAFIALLIGVARGGAMHPGSGLLAW